MISLHYPTNYNKEATSWPHITCTVWQFHFPQPMSCTVDIQTCQWNLRIKLNSIWLPRMTKNQRVDAQVDPKKSKEYCQAADYSLIIYITQSLGFANVWVRMMSSLILIRPNHMYSWLLALVDYQNLWSDLRTKVFFQNFWSVLYLMHSNSLQVHCSETFYFLSFC